MIASLDASMRRSREENPTIALAAYLKPQNYWTRGQAWQLGEYLAERDLLLWIDLMHLHPERAVAWVRFAVDMGLTCPRTFLAISPPIELDDLPLLVETGTWLIQMKEPVKEGLLNQA